MRLNEDDDQGMAWDLDSVVKEFQNLSAWVKISSPYNTTPHIEFDEKWWSHLI